MRVQQGSVLLVSLVLLMVLTLAGLASMRMSSLEEKMTGNFRDQQLAFHAAEIVITEAEAWIMGTDMLSQPFSSSCVSGFCFSGTNLLDTATCRPGSDAPWNSSETWQDSGKHRLSTVNIPSVSEPARYIVEFRCYIPKEAEGPLPDPMNASDWSEYYRVTVLATGGTTSARIMLQTTYKKSR